MLVTLGNFPQSSLSSNEHEEPLNLDVNVPAIAYQPPIPFDPNMDFQFNISEKCERAIEASNWSTTDVSFETPSSYNLTYVNMTFRVRNATTETWATTGTEDTVQKKISFAQGFNITQNATMSGFSIHVTGGTVDRPMTLFIREGAPLGQILYAFPVTIPYSASAYWFNVTLNGSVSLAAGHYYLYYPNQGPSPEGRWYYTVTGAFGDCYANEAQAAYNMTLKVYTKNFIDPESVNMNVSNQPVRNILNGTGWANLSAQISGNTTKRFTVSNSSLIEYAYSGFMICYRALKATNAVNITMDYANWTLTGFSYPGSNYSVYQGNITGFNANHQSIQGFLGESTVSLFRPAPYTVVNFSSALDRITFFSTNYITGVEIPSEVHSNQEVDLNVTVGDLGNVTVNIYNNSKAIYENTTLTSGTYGFRWDVSTSLDAGDYVFEATFFTPNQVGFFRQNITLVKVAAIENYTMRVQALDIMRLSFRLYDVFGGGSTIPNAAVHYHFTDLTGDLLYGDFTNNYNYTKDIDLRTYSILPGNYTLHLEAAKAGYQTILVSMPVAVVAREMNVEITPSATTLVPGSTLEISLAPHDQQTRSDLLRSVDVTIKIYRAGGNPDIDAFVTGTLKTISSNGHLSLTIPSTVAIGVYDILVRVDSVFYEWSKVLSGGLEVVEPPNVWITIGIVAGVAILGIGSYVQRMRYLTKRSVRGAIIMNSGGLPIARRIATEFSTMNPHLIAGAVMGIVTMVKEMTGSSIRTIALEGRYLKIFIKDSFWLVLLTQKNPSWISGLIRRMAMDIEEKYGPAMKAWRGEGVLEIPIDSLLKYWFGVEIKDAREPEFYEGVGNQEITDQNHQPSPSSGDDTMKKE